ncbi:MAG: hypothetical protein EPO61_03210 [Nitrospirae bacterium]|nr:MAG: hypothetical protein EPO61_03210 [Nitrospirota bacterium]
MNALGQRTLLVAALVVLAIVGALAAEWWLSRSPDRPFGHTQAGHVLGWVGLLLILLVLIYPFRKRHRPGQRWPKSLFQVHIVGGLVGPLLILLHAGAHLHALIPVLALITMGFVVLSGIVGQALHALAFRSMNEQRRLLLHRGLPEPEVEARLHALAKQEETFRLWQVIHGPLTVTFVVLAMLHIGGALYYGGF